MIEVDILVVVGFICVVDKSILVSVVAGDVDVLGQMCFVVLKGAVAQDARVRAKAARSGNFMVFFGCDRGFLV